MTWRSRRALVPIRAESSSNGSWRSHRALELMVRCTHAVESNQKGGDPGPDQAKKGADSNLPGWHPKEKATQLPKEGELSKQRGCHQCTKRKGAQEPRCARSEGRRGAVGFYNVVAATAGMRTEAVGVVPVLSPAAIVPPSVACLLGGVSFKSAYARFVFPHFKRKCRRIHHLRFPRP